MFCPLGQGAIDFAALTEGLRGQAYDGWVIVEQDVIPGPDGARPPPSDSARASRRFLRDGLGLSSGHLHAALRTEERGGEDDAEARSSSHHQLRWCEVERDDVAVDGAAFLDEDAARERFEARRRGS